MELDLDVSELEPPEPLELALTHIAMLKAGQYLRVYHRRDPVLLYEFLTENDYRWITVEDDDGMFHIYIWRAVDKVAHSRVVDAVAECNRN